MPSVVIKPARGRDEFVVWSTVTESPHGYGNRTQMAELLQAGIRDNDPGDVVDPLAALDRADRNGSSAMGGWTEGHWGRNEWGWIYKQVGWVQRKDLWQAAVWQCEGRVREILDLLDPLEDDDEHRRLLAKRKRKTRNGTLTPGARIAEAEIAAAGAALGALKAVVESWNRSR